eukprot:7321131-Ditylum_brightwellii.AAC.1
MRDKKETKKTSQKQDNSSAWENKAVKEDSQIKTTAGLQAVENKDTNGEAQNKTTLNPQAVENKDTKEDVQNKATAGPQTVKNKVVKDSVGPQGQVEASAVIILKKEEGYCLKCIIPVKVGSPGNTFIKNRLKNELTRKNAQPLDLSDDDKPLSSLKKSQEQQNKETDAFHIHMERQNASKGELCGMLTSQGC